MLADLGLDRYGVTTGLQRQFRSRATVAIVAIGVLGILLKDVDVLVPRIF